MGRRRGKGGKKGEERESQKGKAKGRDAEEKNMKGRGFGVWRRKNRTKDGEKSGKIYLVTEGEEMLVRKKAWRSTGRYRSPGTL